MKNNIEIANRIKQYAKSRGVSQAHLCESLGKRRTFISEVAAGKDSLDYDEIEIIASTLSTTPSYLLGETDDPTVDGELNAEENELLELYRGLTDGKKELLKKFIEAMSDGR